MSMVELLVITAAVTSLSIYLAYIVSWIYIWRNAPIYKSQSVRHQPFTIVVAMHNEADRAPQLIRSLLAAISSEDKIIIVADHCTDDTVQVLQPFLSEQVQLVDNHLQQGKKFAQSVGVNLASTEFIVTTDADCEVNNNWLLILDNYLSNNNLDMVIMPVKMQSNGTLFGDVLELEFAAIQMATASSALYGNATMCNGANMAFRKEVYLSHNQNLSYVSGDDMFLLASVKQSGGSIGYLKSTDARVSTLVPANFRSYLRQRTRWLRKSSGYTDVDVKRLAAAMFIGNLAWPLALLSGNIFTALSMFVIKTIADFALLFQARQFFSLKIKPLPLCVLAIIYPFNILFIVFMTIFRSKRKW